jgi:hypothetical protein
MLLVFGLGFRLDTPWQGVAWVFMLAGALSAGAGLGLLVRRTTGGDAFVQSEGGG